MTTPTTTEPKWCNLPKEILHRIARHLDLRTDLPKLRAVCPSWRTSLPKNPPIISTTTFKIPKNSPMTFLLSPSHFYLVTPLSNSQPKSKSNSPWLIRVTQTGPNTYYLQNPFNQTKYSYTTSTSLSLLNTTFLELSTTYTLLDEDHDPPTRCCKKVVGGWALDSPFRFSILGQMSLFLFTWNFGEEVLTWVKDATSNDSLKIVESAFYNKKFYSFDICKWEIGVLDPSLPLKPKSNTVKMEFHPAPDILLFNDENVGRCMVTFNSTPFYLRDIYLVPTGVGLYLIFEMCDVGEVDKVRLIVYKMRESGVEEEAEKKKKKKEVLPTWENVESLDDQVFFLGFDTTFSIPNASVNLPQWKPNSICLFNPPGYKDPMKYPEVPETLEWWNYADYGKYVGVFVLGEEENGVVPFEKLPKEVFTGLFFPVPAWANSSR